MRTALVLAVLGAVAGATVAVVAGGDTATTLALIGGACAAAAVAMASAGVRQWRFAPRRRACDALLLTAAAVVLLVCSPGNPFASTGWSLLAFTAGLAVVVAVAWPCGRPKPALDAAYSAAGVGHGEAARSRSY